MRQAANKNAFHLLQDIQIYPVNSTWPKYMLISYFPIYERHLESKESFAFKKYLLIIGKKKNMQVLSHTFTYFST